MFIFVVITGFSICVFLYGYIIRGESGYAALGVAVAAFVVPYILRLIVWEVIETDENGKEIAPNLTPDNEFELNAGLMVIVVALAISAWVYIDEWWGLFFSAVLIFVGHFGVDYVVQLLYGNCRQNSPNQRSTYNPEMPEFRTSSSQDNSFNGIDEESINPSATNNPREQKKKDFDLIIDGTNICFIDGKKSICYPLSLMAGLKNAGYSFYCFFDASTRHHIEKPVYEKLLSKYGSSFVKEVPGGTQADTYILQTANKLGIRIISNDRFNKSGELEKYPNINEKEHLIKYSFIMGEIVIPGLDGLSIEVEENPDTAMDKFNKIMG
jgi:hypothetical protein